MRVLVVTNLYPPHHIGGYELGCRDVVEALRARGHQVPVLTSNFCGGPPVTLEDDVERELLFVDGSVRARHHKLREMRILFQAIRKRRPDVVYFWNQAGLCQWLPAVARGAGYPVAYFLSDSHFVSWRIGAFLARWVGADSAGGLRRSLPGFVARSFLVRGWPVMDGCACHFASRHLQTCAERAAIHVDHRNSLIAYWGVNIAQFSGHDRSRWPVRRLLYVGQLIPQKGVHTAITALAHLIREGGNMDMALTIVGGGLHPDYEAAIRKLPQELGITESVTFLGRVPREEIAGIYATHDVLIFPSEWQEPFAITPLEAIASGLAVVATITGGSGELLREGETAMTFTAGDAADCARAIKALCAERNRFETIRLQARAEVVTKHTLDAMVDKLEQGLRAISS